MSLRAKVESVVGVCPANNVDPTQMVTWTPPTQLVQKSRKGCSTMKSSFKILKMASKPLEMALRRFKNGSKTV